jgi:hypothetical protein
LEESMSTRGCVAVGNPKLWTGRYNHSDSYPSGLGKEVWGMLKRGMDPADILEEFGDEITSHRPDPLFIEWVYVMDDGDQPYGPRNDERLYLDVLASQGFAKKRVSKSGLTATFKSGWWDYGTYACRHVLVGRFPLSGPEPDWELLRELVRSFGDAKEWAEAVLRWDADWKEKLEYVRRVVPSGEAERYALSEADDYFLEWLRLAKRVLRAGEEKARVVLLSEAL